MSSFGRLSLWRFFVREEKRFGDLIDGESMCIELEVLACRGLDRRDEVVEISDSERLRLRNMVIIAVVV